MSPPITVGIIGSGFSGICAAVQVEKQLGIKPTIFESSNDVGGTWKYNYYPGCACDVSSHLYSLSFAPNPNWSSKFSPQAEILEYLRGVARKYGLYDRTLFNTEVVQADWIQDQCKWKLTVRENDVTRVMYFDVIFAGLGPLRVPNYPKEFKSFEGTIVHSAFWDNSIDFTDKSVAIVGSGASAIQMIPKLQPIVKHMTSYQRSPAWCGFRNQYKYSSFVKFLFSWVPFLLKLYRYSIFVRLEMFYLVFGFFDTFIGRFATKFTKQEMAQRLIAKGRPDLVEKLTPDYRLGCRRFTFSENYLEALAEDNVTVERAAIASTQGRTITTVDGNSFECDILVLATGYNVGGFLGNLQINGRNNRNLNSLWDGGNNIKTYKSIAIHEFPNFFMLLGPGSVLGHNSVVVMAEIQVNNAIQCIKQLGPKVKAIEPTEKAQERFMDQLKKSLEKTVWSTHCNSWYKNKNGEIFTLWSSTVTSFYWQLWSNNFKKDFIKYTK
ncbi:putative flavin-binding monooxygenase [Chlamydoabsidia padenii]|nr:putative flavin-binding monooxygenase [Chlamydoabsidia padenii]